LAVDVEVDTVMSELQARVRERLRLELLHSGASPAFADPELFAEVERLFQRAVATGDARALVLPELLGDPETWRLQTSLHYHSHRSGPVASSVIFIKRRVLMPMLRWFFEYSRDNFERQRRINQVLFACVQELAAETARLRKDVREGSSPAARS
jgi:hypothetical protein